MKRVKIFFELEQDDDGYPPAGSESVWGCSTSQSNRFVVDNIPFFIRQATYEDVIVTREEDGNYWFEAVAERSRNSLVRIVFFDERLFPSVNSHLLSLRCSTEYFAGRRLLAVSIPGDASYSDVIQYLAKMDSAVLDYEEAIIRHDPS